MASKCISQHAQLRLPSESLSSLDVGLQVHLWVHSISRSPSASPNSLDPTLQVHLWVHSFSVSKCVAKHARSQPPSTSLSSLDLSLQVLLQTRLIRASKYILKERRRLSGDTGVTEVARVTGSIYSADPRVDSHHLISIWSYHIMKLHTLSFPTSGVTHSVSRYTQFRGSSMPGSIISSHAIPMLVEQEPLILKNSASTLPAVSLSVDSGPSAFQLHRCTTTAPRRCVSEFSHWACPGAPPIMLEYHLRPDGPYVYISSDLNNACHIMM